MYKKSVLLPALLVVTASVVAYLIFSHSQELTKESITFFPLDKNTNFSYAETNIFLYDLKDADEYILKWNIYSDIGTPVYLRQDIGLLYADGRLVAKEAKWLENSQKLSQSKKIHSEDSGHFQAISFHYGEIHKNGDITSSQMMTADQVYVIDSPKAPIDSFKVANTRNEKEWQQILDHATNQQLKYNWSLLVKHFNIPVQKYKMIPLTNFSYYNNHPLPGLNQEQTANAVGRLWEGLYKNYFLGLKNESGITNPMGSTVPLVLVNDNHLLVLIKAANGEMFQLIQYLKKA